MSPLKAALGEAVLISWISVNHRAAPFLTALVDPGSPLRGKLRTLYLCWRHAPSPDGERERAALEETQGQLRQRLGMECPALEPLEWKTEAPPTDHAALRPFAEQVLKKVRDQHPGSPIYLLISPGTPAMHAVWLVLGTTGFIPGPLTIIQTADERGRAAGQPPVQEVRFALDTWLQHYRRARPRAVSTEDNGQLWDPARARSRPLREALEQLTRWAPLLAPVLLHGERGTGKTTMANFLRAMSPFQKLDNEEWPVVVCGQFRVNRELARSELFGHAKGAFTGAKNDHQGLLEKANGDTLFLDEIADIDHDTQRLLMAAVEGRGFHRLGENRVRHSQFRLVSATNRPLDRLVGNVLDPDFFDRIAVFTLRVPPLRECREDIPDLWRGVLGRVVKQAHLAVEGWEALADDKTLLQGLASHALPGNLRDLQRAAFHLLAAMNAGEERGTAVRSALAALPTPSLEGLPHPEELRTRLPLVEGLEPHLGAYRRSWMEAALASAKGNQSEAARLLGIKRETFRDWWKNEKTPTEGQ
ncbi:sigma 54-interacting transcriptional regulator [Stigmatella sp. ncwal1]|uniref:Sigma 54-interacting transcriptional regulator n=1 Tax=Stigmatella ashevillensis TaxID=2995309 RepID=A0ABT5DNK3_9BACT|nr:sigma 54-interacting transcriptional regulator [Stigmatella ashevillena]MDC0715226.1 sigma 54-interacting transcriptional regulator [Stigmatella ashevillena]